MGRTKQIFSRSFGSCPPPRRKLLKIAKKFEHKPSYDKVSSNSSDENVGRDPAIQCGKVMLKEFKPAFNAKLEIQCCLDKNCIFSEQDLSKAFEEIISWCINNNEDDLKKVINDSLDSYSVYKHLIFGVDCRDLQTGYNIREIVSASGNVRIMKLILDAHEIEHLFLGNALEISIIKNDLDMIKCIFCIKPSYAEKYLDLVSDPSKSEHRSIFNVIIKKLSKKELVNVLKKYMQLGRIDLVQVIVDVHESKDAFFGDMLRTAIVEKNIGALKVFLSNEFDINGKRHPNDGPPLHTAVIQNNSEIVRLLLKNGASPFLRDDNCNAFEITKHDPRCSSMNEKHFKPITDHLISKMKENRQLITQNYKAVLSKCKAHEERNERAFNYGPNKHEAFRNLVTYCLTGQADKINEKDHACFLKYCVQDLQTGYRAIDFAAHHGHTEVMKRLLTLGAIAEVEVIWHGRMNLHSAIDVANDNWEDEAVKFLLNDSVTVEDRLVICVRKNFLDLAKCNISDFDCNMPCKSLQDCGYNAFQVAAKLGKIEFLELFIENGANINMLCGDSALQESALHLAAKYGKTRAVEYLLKHGADVFLRNSKKNTALEAMKINYKGEETLTEDSPNAKKEIEILLKSRIRFIEEAQKVNRNSNTSKIEEDSVEIEAEVSNKRKIEDCGDEDEMLPKSKKIVITNIESLNEASNQIQPETDLNILCKSLQEKVQKLEKLIEAKCTQNNGLQEELKKAKDTVVEVLEGRENLIQQNCTKEDNIIKLKTENEKLEIENARERSLNVAANKKVNYLEEKFKTLKSEANSSKIALEARIKALEMDLSNNKEKLSNMVSLNPDDIANFLKSLKTSFFTKDISFNGKMICLSTIDSMITRYPKAIEFVTEKEVIDEIVELVEVIVPKIGNEKSEDLVLIARVLAKIEHTNTGKKLVDAMKISFSASDKLRNEMKKFKDASNPEDFAFDSENNVKMKAEI